MRYWLLVCCVFVLPLVFTSCGQQSTPRTSAAKQAPAKPQEAEYDAQLASGVSRLAAKSADSIEQTASEPTGSKPAALSVPATILEDAPLGALALPQVSLTDELANTCRVKVGDQLPALELPDATGAKKKLASLRGERLTVVVFWNAAQSVALEELADLASPLFQKFASDGLAVVAINSGDSPTLAQELATKAKASFALLSDANREGFEQVASERLPRTYLLDAEGQIVWFDMEYSRTTRRELLQAIRFCLAQADSAQ